MSADKRKTFTPEEIVELVPELESKLRSLIDRKAAWARMHDHLFMHELLSDNERRRGLAETGTDRLDEEARELEEVVSRIKKEIEEIQQTGCIVADLENGWIEFPGVLAGEDVFFCWKLGQSRITCYRLFSSRNRIALDQET